MAFNFDDCLVLINSNRRTGNYIDCYCCWHSGLEFLHFAYFLFAEWNQLIITFFSPFTNATFEQMSVRKWGLIELKRGGMMGGWTGLGIGLNVSSSTYRTAATDRLKARRIRYNGPFDWSAAPPANVYV